MKDIDAILYAPVGKDEKKKDKAAADQHFAIKLDEVRSSMAPSFVVEDVSDEMAECERKLANETIEDVLSDLVLEVQDIIGTENRGDALSLVIPLVESFLAKCRTEHCSGFGVDSDFRAKYLANAAMMTGFNDVFSVFSGKPDAYIKATEYMYEAALQFATDVEHDGIDGYAAMVEQQDQESEQDE
jgi:hypothetical protein